MNHYLLPLRVRWLDPRTIKGVSEFRKNGGYKKRINKVSVNEEVSFTWEIKRLVDPLRVAVAAKAFGVE